MMLNIVEMLEEREDFLLLIMIVLLLLLSTVIWVAFCIAVKRTAVKFLELKRQRRQEYFNNGITLPSYEEALSMGNTPNSDVIPNNLQRAPPYEAVVLKNERLLRIAPDRPGSRRTLTLPPSYDSAMSTEHAPESPETRPRTSNPTQPYTLS